MTHPLEDENRALRAQLRDQERYRCLFQLSTLLQAFVSLDGHLLEVNQALRELLGGGRAVCGELLSDLVHEEDTCVVEEALGRLQWVKGEVTFECRCGSKPDGERTVRWSMFVNSERKEAYCIGQDVTAHKEAMEQLARSQRLLENTARMAKVGGWELDLKTMVPHWSRETAHIHELDGDEQVPAMAEAIQYYAPEARPQLLEAAQRCMTEGIPYDIELPFITAKGNRRWVRSMAQAHRKDGQITQLFGVFQDVTEHRRMQQVIEHAELTLRKLHAINSDSRLDTDERLSRMLTLGTSALNMRYGMISRLEQEALVREYAYSPEVEDLAAGRVGLMGTHCQEVLHRREAYAFHVLEGRKSVACPGGGEPVQAYLGAPILVAGDVYGTLSFCHSLPQESFQQSDVELVKLLSQWIGNVLERERAYRALTEARDEAQVAARAKGAFLATMSHEIRTPMNGVLGLADLLSGTQLDAEQREYVETIQQSGRVLMHILNDILDVSRMESGELQITCHAMDLHQIVKNVVACLDRGRSQSSVTMHVAIDNDVPRHVMGDDLRVAQILTNYVSNAIKFTARGDVVVHLLCVELESNIAKVRIEVRDTGIGIRPADMAQLFNAFSQADGSSTRPFGGSGLGLMICKKLAESMGGRVGVQSEYGVGSTFWVELPMRLSERQVSETCRAGDAHAWTSEPAIRVLVVDDNRVNRMVSRNMLKRLGCTIEEAEDGQVALQKVQESSYDLVLMDCQMPVMDGYEATRAIRAWESERERRSTRIVALTANSSRQDRRRCLDCGMDGFLAKPVAAAELQKVLKGVPSELGRASA